MARSPRPPTRSSFEFGYSDFAMTRDEATWLTERVLSTEARRPPNLLGGYVRSLRAGKQVPAEYFWDDRLPDSTSDQIADLGNSPAPRDLAGCRGRRPYLQPDPEREAQRRGSRARPRAVGADLRHSLEIWVADRPDRLGSVVLPTSPRSGRHSTGPLASRSLPSSSSKTGHDSGYHPRRGGGRLLGRPRTDRRRESLAHKRAQKRAYRESSDSTTGTRESPAPRLDSAGPRSSASCGTSTTGLPTTTRRPSEAANVAD